MPLNQYGQYTPYGYGGYNPYQVPQYPATPQQQTPQPMTAPTIRVDIIRVNNAEEVAGYPVNAGTTQMFQLGDGEAFITKEVFPNGQASIDIYPKQPKKPAPPPFDPSAYVTRDELEERLAGLTGRHRQRREEPEQPQDG